MAPQKIAVIGSGLAGLSAAWLLAQPDHFPDGHPCPEVHLFEKSNMIGMDAASVDVLGGKARVDVPMRGFHPGYYPTLVRLYRVLGIEFTKRNHTVMFCRMDEATLETRPLFSYSNVLRNLIGFGVPIPDFHGANFRSVARLTYDWVRFFYCAHVHASLVRQGRARDDGHGKAAGRLGLVDPDTTLHDYLTRNNYCDAFVYDSLYAMLTGICTCPYEDCKTYPAAVVLEYLGSGLLFEGTSAVTGGVQLVCRVMSKTLPNVHLGVGITSVEAITVDGAQKVRIVEEGSGREHVFDAVVIASQANQALGMLKNPTPEEAAALGSFKYVRVPSYVHTDPRVMPTDRQYWRGLTVVASSNMNAAMSSMYMNNIMRVELGGEPLDVFQTVSPCITLRPESVVSISNFERAVVTTKSMAGLQLLNRIQGSRNIFWVGSYAYEGVPLLEGCVCSSLNAAERLGVSRERVFGDTPAMPTFHQSFWARLFIFVGTVVAWLFGLVL